MLRTILKSKIYGCNVTETNLHYEGSITIDEALMERAGILEGEKVEVFNVNNGGRIETYAIKGKRDSGVICLNGPAARSACAGDEVIILCYALADEKEIGKIKPKIIRLEG